MSRILDIRLRVDGADDDLALPLAGEEIARVLNRAGEVTGLRFMYLGGHVTDFTPPKVQIRAHQYRGKAGFLVMGDRDRIFTTTRESAEVIRKRLRNGEDTRVEDFDPPGITRLSRP